MTEKEPEGFCWWGINEGVYVPQFLLSYRGIGPASKLCFARLVKYTGGSETCWPSQEQLADDLGVTVRSVGNYLAELESDGFIKIIQIGLRQPNKYKPLRHPILKRLFGDTTSCQDRKESSGQDTKEPSGPSIELKEINREEINNAEAQTGTASRIDPGSETAVSFADFLSSWSRHPGFKKPNKSLRSKGETRWPKIKITLTELSAAMDGYHDSDWGKQQNFPLLGFLKDPHSWIADEIRPPVLPIGEDTGGWDSDPVPATVMRDFVAEWNAVVKAKPIEWNVKLSPTKNLAECASNLEFCERFAEVCELAQRAHECRAGAVNYINFAWIIKQKDGVYGWWRLLTDLRDLSEPEPIPKTLLERRMELI